MIELIVLLLIAITFKEPSLFFVPLIVFMFIAALKRKRK